MIKKSISFMLALMLVLTVFVSAPVSAEETEKSLSDSGIGYEIADTAAPDDTAALADDSDYPVITGFQNLSNGVKISWDSYGDNTIYRVYYRKAAVYDGSWEDKYSGAGWTRLATVTGNSYTHTGPADAEIGIYTVRCVDDKGSFTSDYNAQGWENCFYAPPVISELYYDSEGVRLRWAKSWEKHGFYNGEGYRVYRRTSGSGWTRLADYAYDEYTDYTAQAGSTYIYTIRMVDENGDFISDYLSGKSITCGDYPAVTSIANTETGVRLSWSEYVDAEYYRIYYRSANGWTRIGQTSSTSFTDTSVKDGETRVYTVRALDDDDDFISDFNRAGWEHRFFAAPVIKTLSLVADGVQLTWDRPEGAGEYRVYRKTTGGWTRLAQTAEGSFTDKSAVSGTKYIYTLRMISPDTDEFMSDYLSGKSITYVAAPVIKSFSNTDTGAKMTWDKVQGAEVYRIYYKNESGSWTRLASKYATEYTDTSVKNGETRIYTVRCLDEDGDFVSDFYREGFANTFFAPPVIKTISADEGSVTLTWDRTEGAEDYRIYRKTSDSGWTRLAQTSDSSYTDTTVKPGVTYIYTLRLVSYDGERFMSGYLSGKSVICAGAPAFIAITNVAKGVNLKWEKIDGAAYYRVYYYGASGWIRLTQTSSTSYTDTSVKDGETRRYTLRCVNSAGEFITDFNSEGWNHTYYAPPELTSVDYRNGRYTIAWKPKSGVAAYRVYRRVLGDDDWSVIADRYTGTELTDDRYLEDTFVTYTLRAENENGVIISHFVADNPYYRNGFAMDGVVTAGSDTYRFDHGQPVTGYYLEDGTLRCYSSGRLAPGVSVSISEQTRTRWLYELMRASGDDPGVSAYDGQAVFTLAKNRGIISTYSVSDYEKPVTRIFAARTMVAAFNYPKRSVGDISDISSSQSDLDTLAYYGYFEPDKNDRLFPDRELSSSDYNRIVTEMEIYRQLCGKTVVTFGDSIMYGAGNNNRGIGDIVAEKYGMRCYDYSYPGAVMGYYSNKSHIPDQIRKAVNAGRKPDLILLNGGTNDYSHSVPMGSFTSGYDMSDTVESSFTGGFEKSMWLINSAWKNTPVIYIRSHNTKLGIDSLESSFGDRGIEIAEKWHAASIDLYNGSSMNAEIQWICDRYTFNDPDYDPTGCDSIHPTALGYAVFYIPPITDILKVTVG